MSGSLEEAYVAVERAYGQADFAGALQLAQALQPQVPPGRPDLLDQRLQLLIGHIHLYGLNQPAQAAAAYSAVLEGCAEPSYRDLAGQGLEISRQQLPVATEPQQPSASEVVAEPEPAMAAPVETTAEPMSAAAGAPTTGAAHAEQPLPATPWLNQLQDPQQALRQIQEAWGTATPAQSAAAVAAPAAGSGPAEPWQPGGASTAAVEQPAVAPASPEEPAVGQATAPSEAAIPETSGLAVQPAEPRDAEPEDTQAIIPVVVTVEEDETVPARETAPTGASSEAPAEAPSEATAETTAKPEVPAAAAFSDEEWADFKRGLLLVELTTSNEGPTR